MNRPNNRRSKETKENLKEALLTLLSEGKTVDRISVKEICEKSGINRSTFYAHYAVPGDILKEIEETTLKETRNYIAFMAYNEQENTRAFLSCIKRHRSTFSILLSEHSQSDFSEKLIAQIVPIFSEIEQAPFPKHMFDYIKSYAIEGAKALIITWINNNCREDEGTVADLIIDLSRKVVDTAFVRKN